MSSSNAIAMPIYYAKLNTSSKPTETPNADSAAQLCTVSTQPRRRQRWEHTDRHLVEVEPHAELIRKAIAPTQLQLLMEISHDAP
jgi:hypothetical protein